MSVRESRLQESRLAVESGYWPLYRFNPDLAKLNQNQLIVDCKTPDGTLHEFIKGENRYAQLEKINPTEAKALFSKLEKECQNRFDSLEKMASLS